ncbi:MAG: hypothetical protein CSA55_01030 [Ilumatobacter coccineus]|uniref:Predicted membrane protein YciQ-like C-terminal domain-containing protein n=1 Tax=Ilumatobacter coccineus TaxID=467094 RepID=A0A2G6KFC7_9ACTN|nr:MAG: hypothetical protein CSA55_01030 [Ilumatobacter coccineus]
MLARTSRVRHVVVGLSIGFGALLALIGVVGQGVHPERYDAKTVVVTPIDPSTVRVIEYVDQDFGNRSSHGYQKLVPSDFGGVTEVTASSPDAPDRLGVSMVDGWTRIRVGDPDRTIRGQHRYVVSYTYPAVQLIDGHLYLDIVSPRGEAEGDYETTRFEVIVTGVEMDDLTCSAAPRGATGGCVLGREGEIYRAVVEPLRDGYGLTIGGRITQFVDPVAIDPPAIPPRRTPNQMPVVFAILLVGLASAIAAYRWLRRQGRNEVVGSGAADAAYASRSLTELPPPGMARPQPAGPTRLVSDDELAEMATIEFAPPKGVEPWIASVLLREKIDDETVQAWLSGMAGKDAIRFAEMESDLEISRGPRWSDCSPSDRVKLSGIVLTDPYRTGTYSASFAQGWKAILGYQRSVIRKSGWWRQGNPGGGPRGWASSFEAIMVGVLVMVLLLVFVTPLSFANPVIAVGLFGLIIPVTFAAVVYRNLAPSRTAVGSALALQVESFRRFLEASEARHVEWAWEHGLLREYSAWAVALGQADAWGSALEAANLPEPARLATTPLILYSAAPSMMASRVEPASSSAGGFSGGGFSGGGFSGGGFSGGGGGGGSSGSW